MDAKAGAGNLFGNIGKGVEQLVNGATPAERLRAYQDQLPFTRSDLPGAFNTETVEAQVIESLLGKTGTSGGGLLGSTFSSLFGGLVGHNAGGTDDWRGGPTWVGERGPEIVNLPAHATVTSHLASMQRAAGAGRSGPRSHQTITFNVTSPDAPSFAASRTQIEALLSRAAARGQRNA